MEVSRGKESFEKEIEGERMTEEELNKQCNRFGRLVSFHNQLYISPLTYELTSF